MSAAITSLAAVLRRCQNVTCPLNLSGVFFCHLRDATQARILRDHGYPEADVQHLQGTVARWYEARSGVRKMLNIYIYRRRFYRAYIFRTYGYNSQRHGRNAPRPLVE